MDPIDSIDPTNAMDSIDPTGTIDATTRHAMGAIDQAAKKWVGRKVKSQGLTPNATTGFILKYMLCAGRLPD